MPCRKTFRASALAGLFVAAAAAAAIDPDAIGPTFPIAEPDTLAEIQQRGAGKDWKSMMKPSVAENSAFQTARLPVAEKDSTRLFDPTYTLPRDIVDKDGNVVYRQGTRVNVYERVKLPGRYIVIGGDPIYDEWLNKVAKPTPNDRLFLVNGNLLDVRQRTKLPVMAVDERVIERFNLRAVPAIITQEGTQLRVREYAIR